MLSINRSVVFFGHGVGVKSPLAVSRVDQLLLFPAGYVVIPWLRNPKGGEHLSSLTVRIWHHMIGWLVS